MSDFLPEITINTIRPEDDSSIAEVIREVFREHGIIRPGTAYFDPCLDFMYSHHTGKGKTYFIASRQGVVVGGAGIYSTEGLPEDTCELVKMYLNQSVRGRGIGKSLLKKCIEFANQEGYKNIYLETLPELSAAVGMYKANGFVELKESLGNTGHHACDIRMMRSL